MVSDWDPSIYEDEYRKRVEGLIDEKRQGKVIVTERPETEPTKVVDLMEALQASVEAAQRSHRPGGHISAPTAAKEQGPRQTVAAKASAAPPARSSDETSGLSKSGVAGPGHQARHPGTVEESDSPGARDGCGRRQQAGQASQSVVALPGPIPTPRPTAPSTPSTMTVDPAFRYEGMQAPRRTNTPADRAATAAAQVDPLDGPAGAPAV